MFGIGAFELFAILVIAMIILGPDRLPRAMGKVGGWIRELRRLTREFRAEFDEEIKLLQGELETIREEAELTRQELEEIRSDIETSMTEVQEDLQQAGEEMKEELAGAEQDVRAVEQEIHGTGRIASTGGAGRSPALNAPQRSLPAPAPAASSQTPASTPEPPPPALRFPDPSDAMYAAILDTFSTGNGELTVPPQPATASAARAATDKEVLDIGDDWEQVQSAAAGAGETNWEKPPANRPLAFSPQNDQFGAILKAVAESGDEAAASARSALEYQASLDAMELAHLNGKGAAGLAFVWAAQRQAVMEDGDVEIDTSDSEGTRIRLH
ncbi:MAG: Sec-independent protein translocase protein TatB, partial [Chloroflexi bacterium]|nr:Sec-independent protein translocase protein TatB [Chloroflexota bacterium]